MIVTTSEHRANKCRDLARIRATLLQLEYGPEPRFVVGLFLFFGLAAVLIWTIPALPGILGALLYGMIVALALIALSVFLRYSKWPMSLGDKLALQISAYEPENSDAYNRLEDVMRLHGHVPLEDAYYWIDVELYSLNTQEPKHITGAASGFVNGGGTN